MSEKSPQSGYVSKLDRILFASLTALRAKLRSACGVSELRAQTQTIRRCVVVDHVGNTVWEGSLIRIIPNYKS